MRCAEQMLKSGGDDSRRPSPAFLFFSIFHPISLHILSVALCSMSFLLLFAAKRDIHHVRLMMLIATLTDFAHSIICGDRRCIGQHKALTRLCKVMRLSVALSCGHHYIFPLCKQFFLFSFYYFLSILIFAPHRSCVWGIRAGWSARFDNNNNGEWINVRYEKGAIIYYVMTFRLMRNLILIRRRPLQNGFFELIQYLNLAFG